ncbi:butyrophilin-like protein 8 [Scomber scombrus]|uniref:Butyrophilin-like protein 8 n=1 Tax=Scomber scombrus TaxID=13677 RepID=A0AAV1PPC1_SCOSC
MICRILLLISLTSCVSGRLVVAVTQTSYQAEENHNITLEWMFTTKRDGSSTSLSIICYMVTDRKPSVLYYLQKGIEVPESQDEQFAGRVQSEKAALRKGQIRLHVSRLRTDDSGLYWCEVKIDDDLGANRCHLNVTATVDHQQGSGGLYVGLVFTAAGLIAWGVLFCIERKPYYRY